MSAARRAARTLVVALLALLALAPAAGAEPGSTAVPATTTTDDDAWPVRVQITEITPVVLRPGEDLVVRARLTNTSDEAIEAPRAVVNIERIRPGTREDLQTWLDGTPAGTSRERVGSRVALTVVDEPLAPGASVDVETTVPASAVGLLDRPDTWGARGLAVEARDGNVRVGLQRSFVLWATEGGSAQARMSVLAPVVGPAPVPDGVDVEAPGATLAQLVRPDDRLGAVLELARGHADVALAVDPALVVDAHAAGGAVSAWAQQLSSAAVGRDVLALPWSDPDLAALAHADDEELLPLALTTAAEAAASGTQDGTPLVARTDVLWTSSTTTDQATADLAASAGASALVLPPGQVADARTAVETPSGTLTGLVPDSTLTQLLVDPTVLDPDATTATVVQRVLAELSVLAHDSTEGPQHVLVALPRDATPDLALADAVLDAVQDAPWSRTAPLTALLGAGTAPSTATLPATADDAGALADDQVRRLADARRSTLALAEITDDPEAILAGADTAVLAPLASAWRADPQARQGVLDAVVEDLDARRVGLTLRPTSTQNIISATSEVRFSVRNDLAAGASVQVHTTPRKACLRTEPSATVVVPAGGEETVPVTVRAIANCEVVVEATLTSATGDVLAEPVTFVVRASPTVESVGTAVVGVLLAVGLVLGVVRTVRRGQSARRGARLVEGDEGTRPLPVLGGSPDGDA